jgi:predicted amidohydrolase YtcJ
MIHTAFGNRRRFLKSAGAGIGGIGLSAGLAGRAWAQAEPPQLIVHNAKVYTIDDARPQAQAFAVRDGRFVAVGGNAAIKPMAGPQTQMMDAEGAVVVPGFIDTHNHPTGEVLVYEVLVGNPFEVEFVTIDSIVGKLRERAAKTPPDYWVEGFFYDDTKVKDNRPLTRADLDRVSTEHPVVVRHRGGHTSYYNSKAFELAGITKETEAPFGGTYDKDERGELNGRVTDAARAPFSKVGKRPELSAAEREERARAGLAHISKAYVRYGLTSVHHQGGDFFQLQRVREAGDLLHRVSYESNGTMLDVLIANGFRTGFGDEWIRIGATSEHTADGSFSERTLALSHPYPGSNSDYRGNVTQTQEQLNEWVEKVHRAGIQPNIHANGDVAIDMALTAFEHAQKVYPTRDMRPKITHCTLVNPDLIRRIKALGVVPALFTTYAYYNADKFHFYGKELMARAMAYRSLLDAGVRVSGGSDFSPGPFAPLMAMQGMVTRVGWNGEEWGGNQRISVPEALRVLTLNGAYASFEEDIKGSITPGKLADFLMLQGDPHTVDPGKIKDIKILRTVTGGRSVYEA